MRNQPHLPLLLEIYGGNSGGNVKGDDLLNKKSYSLPSLSMYQSAASSSYINGTNLSIHTPSVPTR